LGDRRRRRRLEERKKDNMANTWMEFVKKTRKENPKLSFKDALKKASKNFKKKK